MADGKDAEKEFKKSKKKLSKKGKISLKSRLLLVIVILLGMIFLPTSMLLLVGMLPSIVALFFSARGRGARASAIAAMNLAGCIPFVFKLWSMENDFATSVSIFSNPNYLSIMYVSAAFGYLINWVMTGLVSSYLYQKGITRMKAIKKRQEQLVFHWGDEVSGRKLKVEDD